MEKRGDLEFRRVLSSIKVNKEEAITTIAKELKSAFEDALKGDIEWIDKNHLEVWKILFSWQFNKRERQMLLFGIAGNGKINEILKPFESIKDNIEDKDCLVDELYGLCNYDDEGNILTDEDGYVINNDYEIYDVNELYCGAQTIEEVEERQRKIREEIDILEEKIDTEFERLAIPKVTNVYDLISLFDFASTLQEYIEDGVYPDCLVMHIRNIELSLDKLLKQATPEQKQEIERKAVDELLNKIKNDKVKAGWLYLVEKKVLFFNEQTGYIELSKNYMTNQKGNAGDGATMLFFISAILSGCCKFKCQCYTKDDVVVIGWEYTPDKQEVLRNIRFLCGDAKRNAAAESIKKKYISDVYECRFAPKGSIEIYEMLQEFDRKYNSDAHNATL